MEPVEWVIIIACVFMCIGFYYIGTRDGRRRAVKEVARSTDALRQANHALLTQLKFKNNGKLHKGRPQ